MTNRLTTAEALALIAGTAVRLADGSVVAKRPARRTLAAGEIIPAHLADRFN